MPPFRIPFTNRKTPFLYGLETNNDENARPISGGGELPDHNKARPSLALGIKGNREEPNEFKMSGKTVDRR
jgi:hypothetical protein